MSGVSISMPPQNSLMPPPVPVASTTGDLNDACLLNCSAAAVEKGNTVLEPTILISSRAAAEAAGIASARAPSIRAQRVAASGARRRMRALAAQP
jgi:hypothetical protein